MCMWLSGNSQTGTHTCVPVDEAVYVPRSQCLTESDHKPASWVVLIRGTVRATGLALYPTYQYQLHLVIAPGA